MSNVNEEVKVIELEPEVKKSHRPKTGVVLGAIAATAVAGALLLRKLTKRGKSDEEDVFDEEDYDYTDDEIDAELEAAVDEVAEKPEK